VDNAKKSGAVISETYSPITAKELNPDNRAEAKGAKAAPAEAKAADTKDSKDEKKGATAASAKPQVEGGLVSKKSFQQRLYELVDTSGDGKITRKEVSNFVDFLADNVADDDDIKTLKEFHAAFMKVTKESGETISFSEWTAFPWDANMTKEGNCVFFLNISLSESHVLNLSQALFLPAEHVSLLVVVCSQ
jgi:hypothetical protein